MNKCIFKGNLTKDWEVRSTKEGMSIAKSSIALSRGKDKGADFINLIAFDKRADAIAKYTGKGSQVLLECHVQTGSFENKEGKKVYTTDFVIDNFEFCGSKNDSPAKTDENGFMNIPDGIDEILPFK